MVDAWGLRSAASTSCSSHASSPTTSMWASSHHSSPTTVTSCSKGGGGNVEGGAASSRWTGDRTRVCDASRGGIADICFESRRVLTLLAAIREVGPLLPGYNNSCQANRIPRVGHHGIKEFRGGSRCNVCGGSDQRYQWTEASLWGCAQAG